MSRAKSSSPIKTRIAQSKTACSINQCPVSDPSLGIISENDHRVGLCLCRFCECGKHSCPNPLVKEFYPSSTFTTKYKADYKKGKFDVLLKPEPKSYHPNEMKMDLRTRYQEEFVTHSVSPVKKNLLVWNANVATSQTRSAYSSQYVNWGPSGINHEKRFHPPLRTVEIPFRGNSSYQNSYRSVDPKKMELLWTNGNDLGAAGSKITFGPDQITQFKSTYGEKMRDFSDNELNRIIRVAPVGQDIFANTAPMFQTTSKSFYTGEQMECKDPRLARFQLKKKNK